MILHELWDLCVIVDLVSHHGGNRVGPNYINQYHLQ